MGPIISFGKKSPTRKKPHLSWGRGWVVGLRTEELFYSHGNFFGALQSLNSHLAIKFILHHTLQFWFLPGFQACTNWYRHKLLCFSVCLLTVHYSMSLYWYLFYVRHYVRLLHLSEHLYIFSFNPNGIRSDDLYFTGEGIKAQRS